MLAITPAAAPRAESLAPGDAAFFVEDGRRSRVAVLSARHHALGGQPTRTVRFEGDGDYDVLEALLEPAGPHGAPTPAPPALRSPAAAPRPPELARLAPRAPAAATRAPNPEILPPTPIRPAALGRAQRQAYNQAVRFAASPARADQARGRALMLALQAELAAAGEAAALAAGLAETLALAAARGERIVHAPGAPGQRRIRLVDHDGLAALQLTRDPITSAQYAAGLAYRAGWEARGRDLRAAQIGEAAPTAHDNDRFVAARLKRAQDLQLLARIDRAVALRAAEAKAPEALALLRKVAGEGMALSAFGAGRAFGRNLAALKLALDVAGEVGRARQ